MNERHLLVLEKIEYGAAWYICVYMGKRVVMSLWHAGSSMMLLGKIGVSGLSNKLIFLAFVSKASYQSGSPEKVCY